MTIFKKQKTEATASEMGQGLAYCGVSKFYENKNTAWPLDKHRSVASFCPFLVKTWLNTVTELAVPVSLLLTEALCTAAL